MKNRTLSRFLAVALIAGGALTAAPAVYAAETPAAAPAGAAAPDAPAAAQAEQVQTPFDAAVVQEHMMATITRFEQDDAAGLKAEATMELRPHLTAEQVTGAKAQFAPKWGARGGVGRWQAAYDGGQGGGQVVCHLRDCRGLQGDRRYLPHDLR